MVASRKGPLGVMTAKGDTVSLDASLDLAVLAMGNDGGTEGLALSTRTGWAIFAADQVVT